MEEWCEVCVSFVRNVRDADIGASPVTEGEVGEAGWQEWN